MHTLQQGRAARGTAFSIWQRRNHSQHHQAPAHRDDASTKRCSRYAIIVEYQLRISLHHRGTAWRLLKLCVMMPAWHHRQCAHSFLTCCSGTLSTQPAASKPAYHTSISRLAENRPPTWKSAWYMPGRLSALYLQHTQPSRLCSGMLLAAAGHARTWFCPTPSCCSPSQGSRRGRLQPAGRGC